MENKRSTMGRQKITMAKIPKKTHRQVTFSKRREGLFKKASELCTLCGAEIAIIVFSPAKKIFSFGHPEVESIINRFLSCNPSLVSKGNQLVEACRNANIQELNMQLTQVHDEVEAERKLGEELSKMRKASQSKCWWEAPVEELGLHELEQIRVSMEELKHNVEQQAKRIFMESTSAQISAMNACDGFDNRLANVNAASAFPQGQNYGYGYGFF